jgi:DNA invertase Pin-like site-specific DNA recombinase
MNYAYLRVSTDAQDVANQRHGVNEYAQANKLEPLIYREDTASGKKPWRERELGKLIEATNNGDVLIVSEISRLARSTLQVLEILQACAERGLVVHIAKSKMVMDNSLNSRITATILGLAAEIEREFISARTTEALAKRRAEGLPIGRPKGALGVNKKLSKYRKEILSMLDKGMSKQSIAKYYEVHPETLYNWLHDNDFERYISTKTVEKPVSKKPGTGKDKGGKSN